jgi:FHS family L-fucose permease-like MFS transporter
MTKQNTFAVALIVSMFLFWGLANNMTDTLLAAFKKILSISDFKTSWIQIVFYGAYFCLALPGALFIRRFTYKSGVLLGLGLYITGALLFYPASLTQNYAHFLIALFILAGGLSILETSANPYIIVLGPQETGTRRLNFAQSFNPIGSLTGILLSKLFILSKLNPASAQERLDMGTYVGVAILLIVIWIAIVITRMPRSSDAGTSFDFLAVLRRILPKRHYTYGVIAQFFYVGAQIGVWSFTIRYAMQELKLVEKEAATYYLLSLIIFSLFRFISTALMKVIRPAILLMAAALLAMVCSLITITTGGMTGVIALVLISAFMSLMFPTIFGLAVRGLGGDTKIAGSGLIMAILGGAVLTAIQGRLSDFSGDIKVSYIIPLICFAVILIYARYASVHLKHEQ